MAVGIEIQIDPSGAVSGGRVAEKSLDQIEVAADSATSSINNTSKAMTGTVLPAQQLTKATNTASTSMKQFRGFVGQAGFQISDMAIQLGSGANAAMVFGIQGGQLLGFINPLAGALATVAGILVGQFTGGMYSASESTKTLTDRTRELAEEYDQLTANQARFLMSGTVATLKEQEAQAEKTRAKIETYQMQLSRFPNSAKAEEWNAALIEQQANLDTLTSEMATTNSQIEIYDKVTSGASIASESVTRQIESLSNELQIATLTSQGYNREAAIQAATQRLGTEATEEQRIQVEILTGKLYDLNQQQKTVNATVKEYDRDGEYITRLQQQNEMVDLSARQQAVLRAEYALSASATKEQVEQVKQLAAALYDAQAAKQQDNSDAEFGSMVTGVSRAISMENDTLLEQLENQRGMIQLYQEYGIGDAQAHADALVAIDRRESAERASITASGLGSLLALQQAYGSDSSGVYKTLLVAQKAATLSSVLLSSYDAIGKAWASAPFPYNLGAVATATVETGALSALVTAVTPAFANGGLAYGPGTGTSDSFTARLSNGEFVMPAQQTSRNLSTLEAMRSGQDVTQSNGAVKVNIVNNTKGNVTSSTANWVSRDELTVILNEEVPGIVASEVSNEYSGTNKAMQGQYQMQRNL